MNTLTRLTLSTPTALLLLASLATPAVADTAPDTVIAADTILEQPAPVAPASVSGMVGIDATIVNGLTVTGVGGSRVALTARGERTRTAKPARTSAAVFRNLTAGIAYSVRVNGTLVGVSIPVAAVGPAVGLTVSTTSTPDEVLLRWNQRPTRGQGPGDQLHGRRKALHRPGARHRHGSGGLRVAIGRAATLALGPTARYTFTVTPRNAASVGRSTSATMSRTPIELNGTNDVPTTPSLPAPTPPAPTTPPAPPAPAPGPSMKTIYVCPETFTENAQTICAKTQPYTFTRKAYTFHTEATGPAPILDSYETAVAACPSGYNFEDYGWVKYCRKYGAAPTTSVKDATPGGYTGTRWVTTAAKTATLASPPDTACGFGSRYQTHRLSYLGIL